MKFEIQVIDTEVVVKPTKKGHYNQLTVTYKNLDKDDKIEAKKIMDFAQKDLFESLSKAIKGTTYMVSAEKNEQSGYWDWVEVNQSTGGNPTTVVEKNGNTAAIPAKGSITPKSTYETAEERAVKQKYIIRQSSISSAIQLLDTNGDTENTVADVINIAESFYIYVMCGLNLTVDAMKDDVPQ